MVTSCFIEFSIVALSISLQSELRIGCDFLYIMLYLLCNFSVSHLESLKHERDELQVLLQNQKFTPADVERINREKRELQQTISSLSKSLEDAEQHKWNEEIALAKVKEKVCKQRRAGIDPWFSEIMQQSLFLVSVSFWIPNSWRFKWKAPKFEIWRN